MRVGEFVRAYVVSRWISAKVSAVFPSMLVERLFDGILLTIGLGLCVSFVSLPREFREAGDIFALLTLVGVAAFIYLVLPRDSDDADTKPAGGRVVLKRVREFLIPSLKGYGQSIVKEISIARLRSQYHFSRSRFLLFG